MKKLFLLLSILFIGLSAKATTFTVPTNQTVVDGVTLNAQPGDTVKVLAPTAPATNRSSITFQNFKGSVLKPIIFINSGGVVFVYNMTQFGISFSNCQYFKITGSGHTGFNPNDKTTYGFKVTVATVGVTFRYKTEEFEACYIEVCNGKGQAVNCKTDPVCSDPTTWRQNFQLDNPNLHHFYIHNNGTPAGGGEGFYIGYYRFLTGPDACPSSLPHLIYNLKLHDNYIESVAFDGFQVDCTIQANVYNNIVKDYGTYNYGSQQSGMVVGSGTTGKFYNNKVFKGTGPGITVFGQAGDTVFNNLFVDTGQQGIFIDDRATDTSLPKNQRLGFYILNNTVINSGMEGIRSQAELASVNVVKNNLVVNPKVANYNRNEDYIMVDNHTPNAIITYDTAGNFRCKSVNTAQFENYVAGDYINSNYKLKVTSPFIDKSVSVASYGVKFDIDNRPRPNGVWDAGAWEYYDPQSSPPTTVSCDAKVQELLDFLQ